VLLGSAKNEIKEAFGAGHSRHEAKADGEERT
jgi:hypothetical protein